jgi:hypothetical protein
MLFLELLKLINLTTCKRIWYVSYLQNLQLKKEALSYQPTAGATSL